MKPYQLSAQHRQPTFKVDNSLTPSFNTGELSVSEKQAILENANLLGVLSFIPDGGEQIDLTKIDAEVDGIIY